MSTNNVIKHPGKTQRDKARGVWGNRFTNRDARASWQHDAKATNDNFPYHSVNGKKNAAHRRAYVK